MVKTAQPKEGKQFIKTFEGECQTVVRSELKGAQGGKRLMTVLFCRV
jgi:hypothetical protein